jgi:hypothetical protein
MPREKKKKKQTDKINRYATMTKGKVTYKREKQIKEKNQQTKGTRVDHERSQQRTKWAS